MVEKAIKLVGSWRRDIIMWFKQDCWDNDELTPSKTKVPVVGTVGLQVTYRKLPGSEQMLSFTQKQKCYSEEEVRTRTLIVNKNIKEIYESISKCERHDDLINILDSLIIQRNQFVSVNLETNCGS